jgi:HTH-type transcriptional regulator/antitoxin HipB
MKMRIVRIYCYSGKFMNSRYIGQMIRFHRKKSGLTQEELGKLAGLGKTVVFDVEKGKSSIKLSTLLKLLFVLNIQITFQSPLMSFCEKEIHEKS